MGLFWTFSQICCLSVCLFIGSSAIYLALSDPDINANSEASRLELNELQIATNAEFSPVHVNSSHLSPSTQFADENALTPVKDAILDGDVTSHLQWSDEIVECEARQDKH